MFAQPAFQVRNPYSIHGHSIVNTGHGFKEAVKQPSLAQDRKGEKRQKPLKTLGIGSPSITVCVCDCGEQKRLPHYFLLFDNGTLRIRRKRTTPRLQVQEAHAPSPTALPPAPHPLVIHGSEGTMTIRLMRQSQFRLLVLDETRPSATQAALASLGLSPRGTEILGWVVNGKTSPEIGLILSIGPRTVHKHLEGIYSRLGVKNRHAAMTMAFEVMRRTSF